MSGGVDSSTAAALLKEQGYEVIGITLKVWPQSCTERHEDDCCGPQAVADARNVCRVLDIPHYVVNEVEDFQRFVIDEFVREYRAGRTPNPCILCNDKVKFGTLMHRADILNARFVATGHYARIEADAGGQRMLLKRGCDPKKDQSYFLFNLKQAQLSRALMPLGGLTKPETREMARRHQLKTAEKKESMEICFVPDNNYGNYLVSQGGLKKHTGQIVTREGKVLGQHEGVEFFTIGQRKGLRIAHPEPLYVVDLDPATNRVIVGPSQALDQDTFRVERCNWIPFDTPPATLEAVVKIRYKHPGVPATITPTPEGGAQIKLHQPQRAITPGQACVFYDGDVVLGGGWISR